jgi:NYN domain-containing protein
VLAQVALRLGRLQDFRSWRLKPSVLKALLGGLQDFNKLTDADFIYDTRQKGTDMKIGLDIASVAYKKQVDQIVLVAGDSDFVPAAKLARREGIDFILDPMWNGISNDLHEHIDGLRSTCPRSIQFYGQTAVVPEVPAADARQSAIIGTETVAAEPCKPSLPRLKVMKAAAPATATPAAKTETPGTADGGFRAHGSRWRRPLT